MCGKFGLIRKKPKLKGVEERFGFNFQHEHREVIFSSSRSVYRIVPMFSKTAFVVFLFCIFCEAAIPQREYRTLNGSNNNQNNTNWGLKPSAFERFKIKSGWPNGGFGNGSNIRM